MISRFPRIAAIFTIVLAMASAAAAQVQTGSILVTAVDEQGAVMPGASVAISSPVLPQELTGVTDERGVYRVPGLIVGRYVVKVSLTGFQTVIREDVVVLQGQTANIELSLKVSAINESITVKGESPVVDTKSVGSQTNINAALLETTPGGKDIWNILEYKAPGVVVAGADVGGSQGGLQRSMTARGTPNAQNTQLLNGVNVNDPAAQGFSMNYYIPSAFENVQVSSGAQDIAVGTGGILINMVTKSGTNRFGGMGLQTYQSDKTEATNISTALQATGLRPLANSTALILNSNLQAGGPLVRNKLFYFGSWNYQATHVNVAGFPPVVPSYIASPLANTSIQDTTDILAGEGKVTYQVNASNRFEGYLSKQRYDKPNRGANSTTTQDSDSKELDTFVIAQLSHNVVLSDRMFLDSKVSYNNTHFPLSQKTDLQPITDASTSNTLFRNRNSTAAMFRRRVQVVSNWQYFLPEFIGGRHEFKVGFDNGYTPEDVDTTRVDDVNLTFRSAPTPAATTVQIFNSPLHVERAVMSTALYGQDAYTIGRLNIVGGVRWERIEGYLPAQTTPTGQYFPEGLVFQGVTINGVVQNFTVRKSFPAVHNNPLWHNWGPRVALTYDLTGDGKTALKFSWGRYLDQINTGTPPNPNTGINQTYVWNDLNGDLIFQPGNATWDGQKYVGGEFGTLNSTQNLTVLPFQNVNRPSRQSITVTVDHELIPDLLLSVSYLRTREKDQTTTIDDAIENWASTYTQVQLTDPGRDGVAGTADDQQISAFSLNPGVTTTTKTINDKRVNGRYDGFDIVTTKRLSRGWTLLGGYTYSRQRQDIVSLSNPNNAFVNATGESGGRRHNFKMSGSYELPWNIQFGANFRLSSGDPTNRTWQVPTCTATVVTNCVRPPTGSNNLTINAEPRGNFELPWLPTLDIRFGRTFSINGVKRLELSVDGYNFTNAATIYGIRTGTGLTNIRVAGDPSAPVTQIATFNSPTSVLSPRVFRFNVTYRFGLR